MFNLIESHQQSPHKTILEPLFNILRQEDSLSLFFRDPSMITTLVSQDMFREIKGGAFLLKRNLASLHPRIRKSMASFTSPEGNILTCTVCLDLKKENICSDFEPFLHLFYRKLYESLVEFGEKNKINFLYMTLAPGEYLCTEVIGVWPYVMEVRPQESWDRLFHGILSLTRSPSAANVTAWREQTPKATQLAA